MKYLASLWIDKFPYTDVYTQNINSNMHISFGLVSLPDA